jgi:antitoxin component of RelBE/YafQ-DinJ toxin-antitoxin module|tara:strand:+ start:536 stop:724 length:189 start_codon:yes stop_codon:yes gene_type:complete
VGKSKQNQRVVLFIRIQKDLKDAVTNKANQQNLTVSSAVRQALTDYIEAVNESDSSTVRKAG